MLELEERPLDPADFPEYVRPFVELQETFDSRWADYLKNHEPYPDDFDEEQEYRAAHERLEREHVDCDGLKREIGKLYAALPADQRAELEDYTRYPYSMHLVMHLVGEVISDLQRTRMMGLRTSW